MELHQRTHDLDRDTERPKTRQGEHKKAAYMLYFEHNYSTTSNMDMDAKKLLLRNSAFYNKLNIKVTDFSILYFLEHIDFSILSYAPLVTRDLLD